VITGRVAVLDEFVIVTMGRSHTLRVSDRTPVLLGPTRDFPNVCEDAVGISTVHAIELFDRVEVREMLAVDHDVGRAADPCDAVNGKAHPLVDSEPCIDEGD